MPVCRECGEEAAALRVVKVGGKARKVCEDCIDRAKEQDVIAQESESVIQGMMGFKGRR